MSQPLQGEPPPAPVRISMGWMDFLRGFFHPPLETSEFAELLGTAQSSVVFNHYRARLILSRVRVLAIVFAVLVPIWIPADMLVLPGPVWRPLALGRIAASACFALLARYGCRTPTTAQVRAAVASLFLIPSMFFLLSHAVLLNARLSWDGAILASGYAFLPFVVVAGVSLFPLTAPELAMLLVPLLAVASIPIAEGTGFPMPAFDGAAVLWLLTLVAGVGGLAAIGQMILQRTLFAHSVMDPLTGLLNRRGFREVLMREHARAVRNHEAYSLFVVDVDHFKLFNDGYGHSVGDRALAQVAGALRQTLRAHDWAGRWGGDEFLCLLPGVDSETAWSVVQRLRHQIDALTFTAGGHPVALTVSIGLAGFPRDGDRIDVLLAKSDAALYRAKNLGRNQAAQADSRAPELFTLGRQIEEAIAEGRLRPAYQPIINLQSGQVVAEEALARLVRPGGAVVAAAEFMAAAEILQLGPRIDTAVFQQVLARCAAQPRTGTLHPLQFINSSAALLHDRELIQEWLDGIRCGDELCGGCLNAEGRQPFVIEITERELLGDPKEIIRNLQPWLDFGIRLAVDDFGSGYSSFLYLADLPISFLKIEMQLVQRVRSEPRILTMLKGVANIARDLGLTTIAEGIEDAATAQRIREAGIDWGQGYYFGHPALSPAMDPDGPPSGSQAAGTAGAESHRSG
ncbi:MAG: bifunctional diguanylate cyclase/phosphodiesterase [Gammaproteobacteria bacterium]|nr:bifunctional diguanylate cyclase/phosphodiesterase [Gammaproteobacteria bacterium]